MRLRLPEFSPAAHPPWAPADPMWRTDTSLVGVSEEILESALQKVDEFAGSLVLYADASAAEAHRRGARAFVVTHGDPRSPNLLCTWTQPGYAVTSTVLEECEALLAAVEWVNEHGAGRDRCLVVTDSLATIRALQSHNISAARCPGYHEVLHLHPVGALPHRSPRT